MPWFSKHLHCLTISVGMQSTPGLLKFIYSCFDFSYSLWDSTPGRCDFVCILRHIYSQIPVPLSHIERWMRAIPVHLGDFRFKQIIYISKYGAVEIGVHAEGSSPEWVCVPEITSDSERFLRNINSIYDKSCKKTSILNIIYFLLYHTLLLCKHTFVIKTKFPSVACAKAPPI